MPSAPQTTTQGRSMGKEWASPRQLSTRIRAVSVQTEQAAQASFQPMTSAVNLCEKCQECWVSTVC